MTPRSLDSAALAGLGLLLSLAQSLFGQSRADAARRPTRVHDPSTVIKLQDDYWLFGTGNGIVSRHSRDLVNWEPGPAVFAQPPAWTTNAVPGFKGYFWAPDVIHLNGRYLLYYSVSTWGKRTSAIGLATNATLDPKQPDYRWVDQGPVIQTSDQDNYNAIDPAVSIDADGKLWLALGSFWSGIKLVELNPATGLRSQRESPVLPLAYHESIEAAEVYQHGGYYFLFVNWGACCRGTNSTYEIRVGRSVEITGPYRDRSGVSLLQDGGTLFLGSQGAMIGPGHAGIFTAGNTNWLSFHFYDGARNGTATLGLLPLAWDDDGWPVPGQSEK
jgi:arabinan endo-1,5-alpha-L-arabinosidase